MSAPLVALTLRATRAEHGEAREALARDWLRWCARQGLRPLLVPLGQEDPVEWLRALSPAGLVLTGGNDLGPAAGGLSPPGGSVDEARDRGERALLTHALESGLPVLGVCRGLQLIAAFHGAPLRRVAPERAHVGAHEVALEGPLAAAVGAAARVNSFHDQGVPLAGLPAPLEALAGSPDGLCEALRVRGAPVWAVQWHPEREGGDDPATAWVLERWRARLGRPERGP